MRTRVGSNSLVRDLINLLRRSEGSGHLWRGGIKLPFRRPLPPVAEGSPKPGRSLGQLWLQPRKVSFLNTHCPSAKGVTTAQPGEGGSLWPAPCVSLRSEQRQALSSGLLRAGTWCWACIFRSVLRDVITQWVPGSPLQRGIPHLQQWSGCHCGWAVLLCRGPPFLTSPVLQKFTKSKVWS